MNKVKILIIIPALNVCGGMESFIMLYYRNMDTTKFQFDFLTHEIGANSYRDEIERRGGKIFLFPKFTPKNFIKIKSEYQKILSEGSYTVVHCNMANAAFLYLKEAKHCVPIRILHSHQNKAADKMFNALRNVPLIFIGKRYSNVNIACSVQAGEYLFKNKHFTVINNAIDYQTFKYNQDHRLKIRRELNIPDNTFVVIHTGRLVKVKNHSFLIDVFKELNNINSNSLLLLVGEGPDQTILENKIINLGLQDKTMFLGARSDINELLSASDAFVFPSIYEGLGISVVEAQANGLPSFCSDNLPIEANVSGNLIYISLKESPIYWAKTVLKNSKRFNNLTLNEDYDIKNNVQKLERIYLGEIV